MTLQEYLLDILAEEASEVIQRVLKSSRFGLTEIQKDQPFDSLERIARERDDFIAANEMLEERGFLRPVDRDMVQAKKLAVQQYMWTSRERGTLTDDHQAELASILESTAEYYASGRALNTLYEIRRTVSSGPYGDSYEYVKFSGMTVLWVTRGEGPTQILHMESAQTTLKSIREKLVYEDKTMMVSTAPYYVMIDDDMYADCSLYLNGDADTVYWTESLTAATRLSSSVACQRWIDNIFGETRKVRVMEVFPGP